MMFLQYAIWGAWLPLFWAFLQNHRGLPAGDIGQLFTIGAVGALFAPFIAGQVADRWFNTEKFLAISHVVGAFLVWQLAVVETYNELLVYSILYSLVYAPTLPLTNSLALHHLEDRDRDFPKVRVWGTVGWIAVGIGVGQWIARRYAPEMVDAGKGDALKLSAILGVVMGLFCLTLPKTPPQPGKEKFAPNAVLAAIAKGWRKNPLFWLFVIAFPVSCVHQFYFVRTDGFLTDLRLSSPGIRKVFGAGGGGLMTIGQMTEIAVLAAMPLFAGRFSRKSLLATGLLRLHRALRGVLVPAARLGRHPRARPARPLLRLFHLRRVPDRRRGDGHGRPRERAEPVQPRDHRLRHDRRQRDGRRGRREGDDHAPGVAGGRRLDRDGPLHGLPVPVLGPDVDLRRLPRRAAGVLPLGEAGVGRGELMDLHAWIALATLVAAVVLFVTKWVPMEATALSIPVVLAATGTLDDPKLALNGFGNHAVIAIAAIFILGEGLKASGVATLMARGIEKAAGTSPTRAITIIMIAVCVLSSFMSSAATVAVFMPAVAVLGRRTGVPASRLMMPLAYAAVLGGTLTLIGTTPNLILGADLADRRGEGGTGLGMFEFTKIGAPVAALGIAYMATIGMRMLPSYADPADAAGANLPEKVAEQYGFQGNLYRMGVVANSGIAGQTIAQANIRARYDMDVVLIHRPTTLGVNYIHPKPDLVLLPNDQVYLEGEAVDAWRIAEEEVLQFGVAGPRSLERILGRGLILAEVTLTPHSQVLGKTFRELDFQKRWGCNVISVQHQGENVTSGTGDHRLALGDSFMVSGALKDVRLLAKNPDYVVMTDDSRIEDVRRAPLAVLLMMFAVDPADHRVDAAAAERDRRGTAHARDRLRLAARRTPVGGLARAVHDHRHDPARARARQDGRGSEGGPRDSRAGAVRRRTDGPVLPVRALRRDRRAREQRRGRGRPRAHRRARGRVDAHPDQHHVPGRRDRRELRVRAAVRQPVLPHGDGPGRLHREGLPAGGGRADDSHDRRDGGAADMALKALLREPSPALAMYGCDVDLARGSSTPRTPRRSAARSSCSRPRTTSRTAASSRTTPSSRVATR